MKPNHKNRSKSWVRHHNKRMVKKRRKIYIDFWKNDEKYCPNGLYRKGKVHCSCWSCSPKTKDWGYRFSDYVRDLAIKQQLDDYWKNKY